LARRAAFDVFRDPRFGTRPEVLLIDASDCFILSGVTVDGAFVPYVHKLAFQPLIWGYNESSILGISPERFIWVVHAFNWVDACPFFH
jgi:hypothetical protein